MRITLYSYSHLNHNLNLNAGRNDIRAGRRRLGPVNLAVASSATSHTQPTLIYLSPLLLLLLHTTVTVA